MASILNLSEDWGTLTQIIYTGTEFIIQKEVISDWKRENRCCQKKLISRERSVNRFLKLDLTADGIMESHSEYGRYDELIKYSTVLSLWLP